MSEASPLGERQGGELKWQRLSPWAVLLLLLSGSASLLRQHMPLVLGAGAGLALVERLGLRELALGGAVLLILAVLISLLYYRRFRYCCDGDVLIVQKGLLEHREFKVAARHVQSIVIRQPVYMRPFGLVLWEVETLAGEASRIALPGIRRERAEALERELRPPEQWPGVASESAPAAERQVVPCFAISGKAIVLHGLASRSIYLIAAMLSPLVRPLERWLHDRLPQLDLDTWMPGSPLLAVLVGLLAALTLLALLAILAAWWRFHGFVLLDAGERQIQRSGLFHRQEQTLSLARLQVVEWVQTGLGRLLGRGYLVCHQYGALGGDAGESRRFLVPGLSEAQGAALTAHFWQTYSRQSDSRQGAAGQPLRRVDPSYRRVLFLRYLLLLAGGAVLVLGVLIPLELSWPAWSGLAAVLPLLAAVLAHWRWIATGWAQEQGFLRVRRGVVGQRTGIFPMQHLISLRLQQSWLQRRRGVATLHLELANGRQTLPYLKEDDARRLADTLLFTAESAQLV
ncbi:MULTISPECIES: PH domain-containing protein [Halomonadaceae]|jgi:putative membrane protein|uniref:PH domain-containing protein n=1 Tax=Billgrantia aerodenitrificans TaxID=2733483 RepID=A0ABS9AXB2_9GAMM|nr:MULTISPECIES: PH domain-containing protein [Halomonas]MCE8026547.1 PH domain-containing protein [Halomonas aerodenitrificans]MCE8038583.1 PH domain-containing protein [Halomonas sp. MCCC 1A11062]